MEEHYCSCNKHFISLKSLTRHQKSNPNHLKSVKKRDNITTNDGSSDDENIDDTDNQPLDSISWQQQDVHNYNL